MSIFIMCYCTVTIQLAENLLLSVVFTVIIALPGEIAVTIPFLSTLAISGLLEVHTRVLFVAEDKLIVWTLIAAVVTGGVFISSLSSIIRID